MLFLYMLQLYLNDTDLFLYSSDKNFSSLFPPWCNHLNKTFYKFVVISVVFKEEHESNTGVLPSNSNTNSLYLNLLMIQEGEIDVGMNVLFKSVGIGQDTKYTTHQNNIMCGFK